MIVGRLLLLRKFLILVVQKVLRQVAQVFGSLSILPGPDADTGDEGERFDPREFIAHFVIFARKKNYPLCRSSSAHQLHIPFSS